MSLKFKWETEFKETDGRSESPIPGETEDNDREET